ncbi:hypothetical protein LCGC14_2952970 [marine sediment metagenome]|uniref:Uncharacterized protein n=1 Tax=marine sediment metagenome TaxID=412755 RepID=A0A0F8XF99_9ZZZZ
MPFPEIPEFRSNETTEYYSTNDPVVATAIHKETGMIPMRRGNHTNTLWIFVRTDEIDQASKKFRDLYATAGVTDFHRFVIHLMLDCGQLEKSAEPEVSNKFEPINVKR